MVSAVVLANSILLRAFKEGIPVNLLKLQKLLYYTALDYLHNFDRQLLSESFYRGGHGPILLSVQDEFKAYKEKTIITFARDSMGNVMVIDERKEPRIRKCVDTIWAKYKNRTGDSLSEMSHEAGGAWELAGKKTSKVITEDLMREEIVLRYG